MRKILSILGFAAISLLGVAGTANATTTYTMCGTTVPANPPAGDVEINVSGGCTLNNNVTVTDGRLTINADSLSAGNYNLTARYGIDIETSGNTTTKNLRSTDHSIRVRANNIDVADVTVVNDGHILLLAQKNLKTGNVLGAPGYGVDLKANKDGTNSLLTVGSSSGSNSIQSVASRPRNNYPTATDQVVSITNGTSGSTGGITVVNYSAISAPASGSGAAGYIFVEARDGTLSLPAGAWNLNSGATFAGVFSLSAKDINFSGAATISSNQDSSTSGSLHGIVISAENVTHSGLTLESRGDGYDEYSTGYVQLFPKGAVAISDNESFDSLQIYGTIDFYKEGNLTYTGPSLVLRANGSNSRVYVFSSLSTFDGGSVTVESKGAENHKIQFNTNGMHTGSNGVSFASSQPVIIDASADTDGSGGNVDFFLDRLVVNSSEFTVKANGPNGGSGDGGSIRVSPEQFVQDSATKVRLEANGTGSGNAVYSDLDGFDPKAIEFYPGNVLVKLGVDEGQISLSATGGSSGGNGGAIRISGQSAWLMTEGAVDVSAQGGDGNGGAFQSYAYIAAVDDLLNATEIMVRARGAGNGEGGRFIAYATSFNINQIVKVESGDTAGTSTFGGSISLNGVTCQRWNTGYSWPDSYWNCVNPTAPTALDEVPASAASNLPNNIPSTISTSQNTELYVMADPAQWSLYFATYLDPGIAGYTFAYDVAEPPIYTAMFENTTLTRSGYTALSTQWLTETTIHEMGHQLDKALGLESANGMFNPIVADFEFLNNLGLGAPCTIGTGVTEGPFVGVTDSLTGLPFCTNGVLTSNPNGIYTGRTNADIAQLSSQNLNLVTFFGTTAWAEPYAQALTYRRYAFSSGNFFDPTADGLFQKNYFSCAQAHAASLLGTTFTPTYVYTCQ